MAPHLPVWLHVDGWMDSMQLGLLIGGLMGICIGITCALHVTDQWYRPPPPPPGDRRRSATSVTYGRCSSSNHEDDDGFVDAESGCEMAAPSVGPRRSSGAKPPEGLRAEVAARFPSAPLEEVVRFCDSRPKASAEVIIKLYEEYLEWRRGPGDPQRLPESARAVHQQFIRHSGVARDGTALLYMQAARYDPSIGALTHGCAIAHVIDTFLATTSLKMLSFFIDTRPIQGAHNVLAPKMMPLLRQVATTLANYYPIISNRVYIYPVPWMLKHMWTVGSKTLDEKTQTLVNLISGSSAMGAACPVDLGKYIALDQLPADAQQMHASLASQN